MSLPRAPATLPDDFAAALGHAVASFGFLEEALKRGIHALSFDNLGDTPEERELQDWTERMTHVSGDSLGALIDALLAAMTGPGQSGDRRAMAEELRAVREWRNLLCHASWAPTGDGGWRPAFVSNRGMPVPERVDAPQIMGVRDRAAAVAAEVIAVARSTGHDTWTPDPEAPLRAAERARAQARTAARAAEREPRRRQPALQDEYDIAPPPGRQRQKGHGRRADPRRPRRDPEGGA